MRYSLGINLHVHVFANFTTTLTIVWIIRWVLSNSVFTILRNMDKFEKRNKSKRTKVEHEIFRTDIVTMMQG